MLFHDRDHQSTRALLKWWNFSERNLSKDHTITFACDIIFFLIKSNLTIYYGLQKKGWKLIKNYTLYIFQVFDFFYPCVSNEIFYFNRIISMFIIHVYDIHVIQTSWIQYWQAGKMFQIGNKQVLYLLKGTFFIGVCFSLSIAWNKVNLRLVLNFKKFTSFR